MQPDGTSKHCHVRKVTGVVVTGDGNFAAQDKRFGIEVMAMIGRDQVRLHAAVHNPIAVTTQFRFELKTIH